MGFLTDGLAYLPMLSRFFLFAGLFYAASFNKRAWVFAALSLMMDLYTNWTLFESLKVLATKAIFVAIYIYGIFLWDKNTAEHIPTTTASNTLDDLSNLAINESPTDKRPSIGMHSIRQEEWGYTSAILAIVITIDIAVLGWDLVSKEQISSVLHYAIFGSTAVGYFWLARKIRQAWWLLLASVLLEMLAGFLGIYNYTPKLPIIHLICLFVGLVAWEGEWKRLQNKSAL